MQSVVQFQSVVVTVDEAFDLFGIEFCRVTEVGNKLDAGQVSCADQIAHNHLKDERL